MLIGRIIARAPRRSRAAAYGLAVAMAVAAVLCNSALDLLVPGVAQFILLFPAVVLAGVFCGTTPAAFAAAAGAALAPLLFTVVGGAPSPGVGRLDLVLFLPACAAILWATHTLRRNAEAAAATEARLAEVFRQVPGAAAILEAPSGRLLLRSLNSGAVLGHGQHRMDRADDMADYGGIHADGRPFAPDDYPIVRALHTGEVVRGELIRYRRPDGDMADLEVHAGPVWSADGHILAAVGMAFDVTERVRAERRLLESEAKYRAVAERLRAAIDAGALGVWEIDVNGPMARLDAGLAAMLGYPPEPREITRADFRGRIHPDDRERVIGTMQAAMAEGGIYADECRVTTLQGSVRWFVSRGTVLHDAGRVVGVVSDVTERREREEALQEALRAREVLMREADHRIKNSLQLVVSLLTLQLSKAQDPATRQALGEAIARVDAVANTHLALQRSPDLRTIDLDPMLADLCARVGSLNPALGVQCDAASGCSLDAEIAIPLGLIASELLTNALRHAYPPGATGEVRLAVEHGAGRIILSVTDGGSGLAGAARRPGLGSTVVAALARKIGASVATRSDPGQGTEVTVSLPAGGAPPSASREVVDAAGAA